MPDYMKCNWNGNKNRNNHNDQYEIKFSQCSRTPMNLREECLIVAQHLYEESKSKINLLLSGGIDSEFMARIFLDAKISFKATIFNFIPDKSRHDIPLAIEFCEANSINYQVINFDLLGFFQSQEFQTLTEQYQIHKPFAAVDIKRWQMCDDFPIFGNGDVILKSVGDYNCASEIYDNMKVVSVEDGAHALPYVWQTDNNIDGCYRFFKHSPEQYLSVLLDPDIQNWINMTQFYSPSIHRAFKIPFYQRFYPDMKNRKKLTGYEKLAEEYFAVQKELLSKYNYLKDNADIEYNEIVSKLMPS